MAGSRAAEDGLIAEANGLVCVLRAYAAELQLRVIDLSPFARACVSRARHLTFTIAGRGELTRPLGACRFQFPRRNLWVLPSTNAPHGFTAAAFLFVALVDHVALFAMTA